jgi:hypothetical protein
VSAGEVGWRTGIQPWRFRLNSFPANRLQARPTAAFRTSIPAQVLGGLAWRSQLAESAGGVACRTAPAGATPRIGAGGVCWRCLLAVSVGGVCWRCLVAVFVGGVCWRCLLAVSLGGVAWRCRLAVSVGGVSWRSRLAVSLGGVAWRCRLAVSAGGVGWRSQLAESVGGPPQLGPPPRVEPPRNCPLRRDRETIVPNSPLPVGGVGWRSRLAVSTGGVSWRSQLAESVGGVSWRTGLQPGRFRLNSFPANRLQERPTAVFELPSRLRCLAAGLGGVGWRSRLAESAGGVGWRCLLAVSAGGVACRTAPAGATPQIGAAEELSAQAGPRNDRAQLAPPSWRSGLAEPLGGVSWRSPLAESAGGPLLGRSLLQFDRTVSSGVSSDGERHSWSSGLFGKR